MIMSTNTVIFLEGKSTVLRPLERKDMSTVTRWINDSQITQHLMTYRPMMLEDEERWYESLIGSMDNFVFAIETKSSEKKFIGTMGLHSINHRCQRASTGALIGDTNSHGKGYGTDAKMHLLHWAFTQLNLRKVTSTVLATNPRSKRYLEKTGYRQVGTYTSHHFVNGTFVDELIMEVFCDEFMKTWEAYNT